MDKFAKIKEEIEELAKKAEYGIEYSHIISVLKWALKLKPDADTALQIAALGHDIDRYDGKKIKREDFSDYEKFKQTHARRSALIIESMMKKLDFDKETIKKTKLLIENHEVGGDGDLGILKEADSLSFFDNNVYDYWKTHNLYFKDKILFMYKRLSKRGKEMVKSLNLKDLEIEKKVRGIISDFDAEDLRGR